jgi:hypothetical protein
MSTDEFNKTINDWLEKLMQRISRPFRQRLSLVHRTHLVRVTNKPDPVHLGYQGRGTGMKA